jgi:uncharacterized protein
VAGLFLARADLPERFARWVVARVQAEPGWRVLVGHCDNAREGERVVAALRAILPGCRDVELVEAGAAISAHAGPGAIVVGLMPAA